MTELLTVREVADRLGCSRQAVYRWVAKGYLKTERWPGGTRARIRIPWPQGVLETPKSDVE